MTLLKYNFYISFRIKLNVYNLKRGGHLLVQQSTIPHLWTPLTDQLMRFMTQRWSAQCTTVHRSCAVSRTESLSSGRVTTWRFHQRFTGIPLPTSILAAWFTEIRWQVGQPWLTVSLTLYPGFDLHRILLCI